MQGEKSETKQSFLFLWSQERRQFETLVFYGMQGEKSETKQSFLFLWSQERRQFETPAVPG